MIIVGFSGGATGLPMYAPRIKDRFQPGVLTLIADSSPGFLIGECPGLLLYTNVLAQVNGCGMLPTMALQDQCFAGLPVDAVDVISAALDLLGPEVLYLEIASKADAINIDTLASFGVTTTEVIEDVAPQCVDPLIDPTDALFVFETSSDYYTQLTRAHDAIKYPNYKAYFVTRSNHLYVDVATIIGTLGTLENVTNPFAQGNVTSVPAFLDTVVDAQPSVFFIADAGAVWGSYEPSIADWLRTAVLSRIATSECDGPVLGANFTGNIRTCSAERTSYDAARDCTSDTDCPPGMTCFSSSSRRRLRFGYGDSKTGACRRQQVPSS